MDLGSIVAPFTRLAAVIAVLAGIIVLSYAFAAARRARRRNVARRAAKDRCRRLVAQMRRCPKLRRPQDRRLAEKFLVELEAIMKEHAFGLVEIGTSRTEIEGILRLVREEEVPFMKRIAPPPRGTETSGVRAIILPAPVAGTEPCVLSEPTFSEADFPPCDGDRPEPAEAVPAPARTHVREPLRELQTVEDGELEAFIDDGFAAIVKNG